MNDIRDKIDADILRTSRRVKNLCIALTLYGFLLSLGYSAATIYAIKNKEYATACKTAAMSVLGAAGVRLGTETYRKFRKIRNEQY